MNNTASKPALPAALLTLLISRSPIIALRIKFNVFSRIITEYFDAWKETTHCKSENKTFLARETKFRSAISGKIPLNPGKLILLG